MKKQILRLFIALGALSAVVSCKDFQEINENPNSVPADQVQIDYFLNNSIMGAQMDPHVAERAFILYWDRAAGYEARGGLTLFSASNDWSTDYYGTGYLSGWIKNATMAVQFGEERLDDESYLNTNNLLQVARIWRAYLLSEMADNFGPASLSQYDGTLPSTMESVEDLYSFILSELADATTSLDLTTSATDTQAANDLFYSGNYDSWQKFGNSLSLRLALRIGNQAAFEAAAQRPYITTQSEIASVLECGSWNSTTGVMTRSWNSQNISRTYASLCMGMGNDINDITAVGGTAVSGLSADIIAAYAKDPNQYLGVKMDAYLGTKTNRMDAAYLFDAIPSVADPRLFVNFSIPGVNDGTVQTYTLSSDNVEVTLADSTNTSGQPIVPASNQTKVTMRAAYTFHSFIPGDGGVYASNFNEFTSSASNVPSKSAQWRDNANRRVFMGPWDVQFLLAEAALNGWSTGTDAQTAYEAGVRASFDYFGITTLADSYLSSTSYNRNGTSVAWTHTTEATSTAMNYYDFNDNLSITGDKTRVLNQDNPTMESVNYEYPVGTPDVQNNELLMKVITQKYIANSPWLPLEAWCDYRRLNIPFMENPLVENTISTMPWYSADECGSFQWENVPQRLIYPTGLQSTNSSAYLSGVEQLGGADEISTPLSWARKQ